MSIKEELREKKVILTFHFWKKKRLNRVDIHVIYVKKLLNKWIFEDTHHMNKTLGICEINLMIQVLIK